MSYIERNLMNDEQIGYSSRLHRIIFIWPVIWFIIALALFGAGVTMKRSDDKTWLLIAAGFFTVIALLSFLGPLIQYVSSEFGITNRRIIMKSGFIRRRTLEVLLNKVESILVDQSISGRLLGFGSITITGTGGTKDSFHNISAPFEFRKRAQEQIGSVYDSANR